MTDHAYAAWLSEDDLLASINLLAPKLSQMILEAVDEVVFSDFSGDIDLRRYTTGRIFGANAEIRWQRDGEQLHTSFLGDVAHVGQRFGTYHVEISEAAFKRQTKRYYLWGEWSERLPQWVEASVPHIFNYPSPNISNYPPPTGEVSFRRKMIVVEYINAVSGDLEFYRFTGTEEERL